MRFAFLVAAAALLLTMGCAQMVEGSSHSKWHGAGLPVPPGSKEVGRDTEIARVIWGQAHRQVNYLAPAGMDANDVDAFYTRLPAGEDFRSWSWCAGAPTVSTAPGFTWIRGDRILNLLAVINEIPDDYEIPAGRVLIALIRYPISQKALRATGCHE